MFSSFYNLPPILKIRYLLFGGILLVFSAWNFSLSKTWDLFLEKNKNTATLELVATAPGESADIQNKLRVQQIQQEDFITNRAALFEQINQICGNNNLLITQYAPEVKESMDGFDIITTQIQVQGSYKSIVTLAYTIEQDLKIAHISSLNFASQEDLRTHKTLLNASLFLQYLVQSK